MNSSNTVTTPTQPRKLEPKSEDTTPGSAIKKPRAKHRMINAYGSSGKAAKTRRCGKFSFDHFRSRLKSEKNVI